jgi:glycosyltransferase involved in cell wall biosynthesis
VPSTVAVIVKGYPRLSETFIAEEVRALERLGLEIRLYSLRRPTDRAVHPVHGDVKAGVTYLPEYLHHAPWRVVRAWRRVRRSPGYRPARAAWLRDLRRDPTRNRIRRFGQALVLAAELGGDVGWLHAHFLHTPASVTRYAALLTDRPWSVSAHAKDVWTIPEWEKRDKLAACRWLTTCSRFTADHLAALTDDPERVGLAYHGLPLDRFPPPAESRLPRAGTSADDAVTILCVGRAVEKKGIDLVLSALARLPADLHWRFVHIGGGPLLARLRCQAKRAGIQDRVRWLGARPQDEVLAACRAADLFVLASRVAAGGDRDGLPNVLMEAQSQGLACVATRVAAIPELIEDGVTGALVAPDDVAALAMAIDRLARAPLLRARLGGAALRRVHDHFSQDACIVPLARRFHLLPADAAPCASPSTRR